MAASWCREEEEAMRRFACTGGQFNCFIEYSIDFYILFSSAVGHPVTLNRKLNRMFISIIVELGP